MPNLKVFVSHSHLDYDKAVWVKEDLERYGLEVFIAHKDIAPSLEWRDEIVSQIKGCDLFVALLTSNYKASPWCDQECGIAYANRKPMLPVAIELMPYGFLERFQAMFWDATDTRKNRTNLIETVLRRLPIPTESIVTGFVTSDTFAEAAMAFGLPLRRPDLTKEQIRRVAAAWFTNSQIRGSGVARKMLPQFYERHGDKLPVALRDRLESYISKSDEI